MGLTKPKRNENDDLSDGNLSTSPSSSPEPKKKKKKKASEMLDSPSPSPELKKKKRKKEPHETSDSSSPPSSPEFKKRKDKHIPKKKKSIDSEDDTYPVHPVPDYWFGPTEELDATIKGKCCFCFFFKTNITFRSNS